MQPEPYLDIPFLIMTLCAVVFNVLTVIYFVKARNYKKQLDECKRHFNNTTASLTKPINSATEAAKTSNQSKGEGTF